MPAAVLALEEQFVFIKREPRETMLRFYDHSTLSLLHLKEGSGTRVCCRMCATDIML